MGRAMRVPQPGSETMLDPAGLESAGQILRFILFVFRFLDGLKGEGNSSLPEERTFMPPQSERANLDPRWNDEAKRLALQARVLSGEKLIELISRLQRITGNSKDACWRFIRQHALRGKHDYRRWTPEEFDQLREELASHPLQTVAKKVGRTEESIRSIPCAQWSFGALYSLRHVLHRKLGQRTEGGSA